MKHLIISLLMTLIITSVMVSAEAISDPERISYAAIEAVQSGYITLNPNSGSATAEDLKLTLYIPQTDMRQTSEIIDVIGPDDYYIKEDEYGNDQIVLTWARPSIGSRLEYIIESSTVIRSKSSNAVRNFDVTPLVEPSPGIIETSYDINSGKNDVINMLRLATWINENVKYDLSCEDEAFSATWVFDEMRGTCDEFANLMVSMLSSIDYNSWYVAGYAFLGGRQEGGDEFGSHAWTEVRIDGKTYSVDPTWSESPVDATHITFARLPDSNFTEHSEVKSRDINIEWNKLETRLSLVDYTEEPRLELDIEAVPSESLGGDYVLLKADVTGSGCMATNMRIASCIDEKSNDLIIFNNTDMAVFFCDSDAFYWIGKTAEINRGMKYMCPVTVAGGGGIAKNSVSIESKTTDLYDILVSTDNALLPGENFEVVITAQNSDFSERLFSIISIIGNSVEESNILVDGMESSVVRHTHTAPETPGTYDIMIFSSTGDMRKKVLEVLNSQQFTITGIEYPKNLELTNAGNYTIEVLNGGEAGSVNVSIKVGDKNDEETLFIDAGESGSAHFEMQFSSEGRKNIIVSLISDDGYEDGWTGNTIAYRSVTLKESVSSELEKFILMIIDFFRSIFS
ncbi:MAG: transglutaminase domain-containing protein [Candidatus Aenigmarchaeota archaeon]|nr:transglutaminase domain-containing protein [Candidatus Aenigmarchaeota archaeon]